MFLSKFGIPEIVSDIIWIISVFSLFYIINWFLKDLISIKVRKFLLDNSFFFAIIILITGFFIPSDTLKTAIFTFSSVYLGFWLSEQSKTIEERRRLKFFLGLVWQELRFNRHQLEITKKNFKFYLESTELLEINFARLSSVTALTKLLKTQIYSSFISSGIITSIKSDYVFNSLEIAYNDIKYLESTLKPILEDFAIKVKIQKEYIEKINKNPYE